MYFGVTDVENRLTVYDNAAQVLPGVEAGKPTPAAQVSDTMQRPRWLSPRFLMGAAGALSPASSHILLMMVSSLMRSGPRKDPGGL